MPRVLLISGREKGHVNPLVGVAQWLAREGAEVGWLCLPEPPDQLALQPVEPLAFPGSLPEHTTSGPELAAIVRDPMRLRPWLRALLVDGVEDQLRGFRRAISFFAPDVIALDPMLYGAILAAHEARIPWVALSSSLNPVVPEDWSSDLKDHLGALDADRRALFARHGLEPRFAVADCLSPWGTVVFATRGLVGDVALPEGVQLVGPSLPIGPRGDETDLPELPEGPLVYASFGSQISWQPELYARLAQAASRIGASLLLSAGELANDAEFCGSLPENTRIVSYAPQRRVLQDAAVFVTHAGANSVMEAIYAGVPLLVSPVCNDQPHNARFARQSGIATQMDADTATVEEIAQALAQLLDLESPVRTRIRDLQADYRLRDGAHRACDLILEASR